MKDKKILFALFLFSFLINCIFILSSPLRIWDETVYANLGYDLSKNPFDYSVSNNGWSDFIPSADKNYGWPKVGFRAPLLPYFLAFFYLLKMEVLILFVVPAIGAASACLVFILSKNLFNKKIALYSSLFFLTAPLFVTYSAKILTGILLTFFTLLSFISFWKGFEQGQKKYKVLFGVFLALALLSRYTALWIIPVFLIYLLIRDRSLKFLKDNYLWLAIIAFLVVLTPWFLYGFFEYGNVFGAFIHGAKAALYWGGTQTWHFFFDNWWQMFSVLGVVFVLSLAYIFYKKEFIRKEICLVLIWGGFFLLMASLMPHKEDRFILPIVPAVAILSGFFASKLRRYEKIVFFLIIAASLISASINFYQTYADSYNDKNFCFLEANGFLKNYTGAVVITDESALVYYYSKQETWFYPDHSNASLIKYNALANYPEKEKLILFTDMDMPLENPANSELKESFDNNFEKIFECEKPEGYSAIYRIN